MDSSSNSANTSGPSPKLHEHTKDGNVLVKQATPTGGKKKTKFGSILDPAWQNCLIALKEFYPDCLACQRGFMGLLLLIDHVVIVHCSEKAMKLFGNGDQCDLCNKFTAPLVPKMEPRELCIKSHMSKHFKHVLPRQLKPTFLAALKSGCNRKVAESQKETKQPSLPWQECQTYLRDKFPECRKCQQEPKCPSHIAYHAVITHYGAEALKHFGNGQVCEVCKEFKLTLKNTEQRSYQHNIFIKQHMKKHLDCVIPSEARSLFLHAFHKGQKNWSKTHSNSEQAEEEKSTIQALEPIQNKESSINTITKPNCAFKECEDYFKEAYPTCSSCTAGHKSLPDLKSHVTEVHYGNSAIELFGHGNACPVCEQAIVSSESTRKNSIGRIKSIKEHMSLHLEEFVLGKARSLLIKAKNENTEDNSVELPCATEEQANDSEKMLDHSDKQIDKPTISEVQDEILMESDEMEHITENIPKVPEVQDDSECAPNIDQKVEEGSAITSSGAQESTNNNDPNISDFQADTVEQMPSELSIQNDENPPNVPIILEQANSILLESSDVQNGAAEQEPAEKSDTNETAEGGSIASRRKVRSCNIKVSRTLDLQPEHHEAPNSPTKTSEQWTHSDYSWQDCEEYFRQKYPSCNKCRAGHQFLALLRRHITSAHHGKVAMQMFGKGPKCSICQNVSVPFNHKNVTRKHLIKCHMALHLELFIQDEEAIKHLLKAKSAGKRSSEKRILSEVSIGGKKRSFNPTKTQNNSTLSLTQNSMIGSPTDSPNTSDGNNSSSPSCMESPSFDEAPAEAPDEAPAEAPLPSPTLDTQSPHKGENKGQVETVENVSDQTSPSVGTRRSARSRTRSQINETPELAPTVGTKRTLSIGTEQPIGKTPVRCKRPKRYFSKKRPLKIAGSWRDSNIRVVSDTDDEGSNNNTMEAACDDDKEKAFWAD